jgi:hypothetical protein
VRPVRAALLRACVITVAAVCAITVSPLPASAAPLSSAPAVQAAAATGAATNAAPSAVAAAPSAADPGAGTGALQPFEGILFEHGDQAPREYYRIVPDWNTGLAMIQDSRGACLSSNPRGGPRPEHQKVDRETCRANYPDHQFYFIPQNHNPRATPDSTRGDQYFYIVSAATDDCIWAGNKGLDFGPDDFAQQAHMWRCAEGDPGQEWIFRNEVVEEGVALRWSQLLALATVHSTNRCLDRPGACQVSPDSGPFAGQWFESADPDVSVLGTVSSISQGCGTGETSATINAGSSTDPTTVSGTVSVAKSVAVSLALNSSTKAVAETGVKDVWGAELSASFSIGEQIAQTIGTTKSVTRTISAVIPAGAALMGQYSQRTYAFSGAWQMDIEHPRTVGSLAWSIPARTSLPVILDGADPTTYSPVGSKFPKDCTAGGAARNSAPPVITTDPATCASTPRVPTGAVLEELHVCPGSWDIAAASDPARYAYEWYLTQGGTDGIHPIAGSVGVGTRFTIRQSTASGMTPTYIGVRITEVGSATRLDSEPAVAANPVLLASTVTPPAGAATVDGEPAASADAAAAAIEPAAAQTAFIAALPVAVAGQPYSASVVADPAAGLHLAVAPGSTLPAGLTLSPAGELTGTPTDNGVFDLEIADAGANGADPVSASVRLVIETPTTVYTATAALGGTVGAGLETALVTEAPEGLSLSVDGPLPRGLQLDPATGVLSGTPQEAGRFEFVLDNADANVDRPTGFVLEIAPSTAVFSGTAPASAEVGTAFSFPLLTAEGSHTALALAEGELPQGLALDSSSGVISGTPTAAGRHTVTVVDTGAPSPTSRTVEFVVLASAGQDPSQPDPANPGQPAGPGAAGPDASKPAGSGGSLASTGAPAGSMLATGTAAALILAAGLTLVVIRRRRSATR